MSNESPTPETDKYTQNAEMFWKGCKVVPCVLSQRLERERDEARRERDDLQRKLETIRSLTSIFVVTAFRYGMRDAHSYVVGAYATRCEADQVAKHHVQFRGGKYGCEVAECKEQSADLDDRELPVQVKFFESPYHGMIGNGRQPADHTSMDHKRKFRDVLESPAEEQREGGR